MTTTTIEGSVDAAVFDELRPKLRQPLILPADDGYDGARAIWNAMIDRRPAAIARPLGTAEVISCVTFARSHEIPISIRGGGHNIAGLAIADSALLIDLSSMRGVWVDPAERIAVAQGGCLLGDVDRDTQVHGLAAVMGFVSNTGAAGLTLGGGFGYLTRRFGWTSDGLESIDVVTAEGQAIRASETEHPDLFWGLRGGGGNFGVATSFRYRLEPIGPEIIGGAIAWRADDAPEVLAMYRELAAEAPPELTCVAIVRPAPPAPWLPPEIHGQPIVVLVVCDTGPIDEAERRAKAIKGFGSPVGDVVVRRPYVVQQSLLDGTQPKGRRYYWKSEYLPGVSEATVDTLLANRHGFPSPHSGIIVFPLDGPHQALPGDHSAVGNRDAGVVINVGASWERADDDGACVEWARTAWQGFRSESTGGVYVNFLTDDEGDDRTAAAYRDNLARLGEVKRVWDPDNVFRLNKNISPVGG